MATDEKDTGKHPIIITWKRWVISTSFWIMLLLYAGMYIAYFGVILLWCILGAILNPQTFLPLASGAGVIIGCVIFFYSTLTKINKDLDEIVGKVIEEQLQITLVNSINNNEIISKIIETADDLPKVTFNTAINAFLEMNHLQKLERNITDEIMKGNVDSLAIVLESSFMIPPEVSKGIVGMVIDDPLLILS
jgi:hypothetical protein